MNRRINKILVKIKCLVLLSLIVLVVTSCISEPQNKGFDVAPRSELFKDKASDRSNSSNFEVDETEQTINVEDLLSQPSFECPEDEEQTNSETKNGFDKNSSAEKSAEKNGQSANNGAAHDYSNVSIPELDPDAEVLEISEKMFLTQINDIYYNYDSYKDKTIVVEGMYAEFFSSLENKSAPGVFRFGPGCCGNDGWGGFVLKYEGTTPEEGDWIRVTGKPVWEKTEKGFQNLLLDVISLEEKEERGAEIVYQ